MPSANVLTSVGIATKFVGGIEAVPVNQTHNRWRRGSRWIEPLE